ncbi:CBL-interacting serine threonine-protein kinase [Musa troglodytarum]|uniref:non-specific serine/threonine protein kinase n=1 Tax=Musa troglodytarum TaxID=320322 RepID=A0A9E7FNL4_9LILI|nr:CBL-interacting serine threonine-protein kinase [Musa troglodytarum]
MVVLRRVGKYEVGRTIGEGTFAKVKFAQNTETGESVAMKVLDRATIIKHNMVDQIKREISIMKLVRHPYVVRLHEVLASRTKIYIILEFITGGELFDKIIHHGKLSEAESRRYFQQLIDGVQYCHSKGVYHRDLKPENLLLDSQGNLKISDFGLSAMPAQGVSLLRTTCGTPNYVAPEIEKAEFSCPSWFSIGAKSLLCKILDPNPETRMRIEEIRNDEWFKKNYVPVCEVETEDINLDDVFAAFDDPEASEQSRNEELGPLNLNAFDLIILSQGLNLSALFDRRQDYTRHETRFLSRKSARVVLSSMEVVAQSMGFKTHIRNYKMRVEGLTANKAAHLSIMIEIFEIAPSFLMVEIQRAGGEAADYLKFNQNFCSKLDDIIWKSAIEKSKSHITRMPKR